MAMDWQTIDGFRDELRRFLRHFDDCFARREGREHLQHYVRGQLSTLERKNVEALAEAAGVPPRTLQDFLATHTWDHPRAVDRLQQLVAAEHHDEQAIGLFDETSFAKRGEHTAGVQRQYCGTTGKIDNCVVSVHLGYATFDGRFRCLLDGRLTLPESWEDDTARCEAAAVPRELRHQPKWRIALQLLRGALSNGVRFRWLVFDEGYGACVKLLSALNAMGQTYVAEVPRTFHGWLLEPTVLQQAHHASSTGRPRHFPRLAVKSLPSCSVERLCRHSYPMRDQSWQAFHIKDTGKGPVVWQAKAARFRYRRPDASGGRHVPTPSAPCWLIVARNVLSDEVKYFVSNAPAGTPLETILHVAFSRWHIERLFQDDKSQLGLDHFECRRWHAIHRHFLISAISHLLLARLRLQLEHRGEKDTESTATAPGGGRLDPRRRPTPSPAP
jgi:SRSO17 transposase